MISSAASAEDTADMTLVPTEYSNVESPEYDMSRILFNLWDMYTSRMSSPVTNVCLCQSPHARFRQTYSLLDLSSGGNHRRYR